jgi:CheY-like chemotaxis protein
MTEAAPISRNTVLIVDDELPIRSAVARLLSRAGYDSLQAANGSEAIHIFAEQSDKLVAVLLDLNMPTTNGRETLAMLHAYAPHLPIVICTAITPPDDLEPAPGSLGVGFLQKPFTPEQLKAELERVIVESLA